MASDRHSNTQRHAGFIERLTSWVRSVGAQRLGIVIAVLLALGIGGYRWWSYVSATPVGELTSSDAGGGSGASAGQGVRVASESATESAAGSITVHVVGAVAAPGVYRLPAGARVTDAVTAAGGPRSDSACDAINMAALLSDAVQVYVPTRREVKQGWTQPQTQSAITGGEGAGTASSSGGNTSASALIDINSATAEQLDALPGIGPSTAAKIIADRVANGRFATLGDLSRVSGIGEKKVAALEGYAVCR